MQPRVKGLGTATFSNFVSLHVGIILQEASRTMLLCCCIVGCFIHGTAAATSAAWPLVAAFGAGGAGCSGLAWMLMDT